MMLHPADERLFWHDDPIPDPQRREIFFVHQLIAARRCDAKQLCHRRGIQEQWQLVIILVD